jgi:hypothetical protein
VEEIGGICNMPTRSKKYIHIVKPENLNGDIRMD